MVGRVHLTKHISLDELRRRYRNEKNPRVKERLLAILHLYEGKTVKEVSKIIKRSVRSIEGWVKIWNERNYDGLIPHFTRGPKPKLPESEWDKVVKESSKDDPIIGFLDETSISPDSNRRRVLCTPVVTYSEGEGKRSRTIFEFMALNSNDVVMVSETAKAPDMASFLELVRRKGEPCSSHRDSPG